MTFKALNLKGDDLWTFEKEMQCLRRILSVVIPFYISRTVIIVIRTRTFSES